MAMSLLQTRQQSKFCGPVTLLAQRSGPDHNVRKHAMADRPIHTPELLRQLLRYEPDTGKLFWKERPAEMFEASGKCARESRCRNWNSRFAGKEAFTSLNSCGYLHGSLLYKYVRAHRVAFAHFYGQWPVLDIDHINGIRTDNRIANLREVDRSTNLMNQRSRSHGTHPRVGVSWDSRTGTWQAQIRAFGKNEHLGRFGNVEAAIAARECAERRLGFHPNHGRRQ